MQVVVAVAAVVLIVASVIAQNAAAVTLAGPRLIAAIIALHSGTSLLHTHCLVEESCSTSRDVH